MKLYYIRGSKFRAEEALKVLKDAYGGKVTNPNGWSFDNPEYWYYVFRGAVRCSKPCKETRPLLEDLGEELKLPKELILDGTLKIIRELESIALDNPEMRFGQLLVNYGLIQFKNELHTEAVDPFYVTNEMMWYNLNKKSK